MNVLGIIPARGGSRRIPGKNLAPCAGRPLLHYTCQAALGSVLLTWTVVSTEDAAIADMGRREGVEVMIRSQALAAHETPMLPVVLDVLDRVETQGQSLDAIVLLQPTSPLRTAAHIDEALAIFHRHAPDSVVSVTAVPHIFHPLKLVQELDGRLRPYLAHCPPAAGHRDLPPVFAKNGPAVLVMRPECVRAGSLYGEVCLPYVMRPEESVDVDEPIDLALAEVLLIRRQAGHE